MHAFYDGVFLQAGLILALGAQNLFVLESGLAKRRHILVATLCSVCDLALIALGVFGAGSLFLSYPWLKFGFGILGVAFLAYYGLLKIFHRPSVQDLALPPSKSSVVSQTLAFSLLNPHVYLDTVVLIGGSSTRYPLLVERGFFGLGAGSFSVVWFFGLAFFSAALGPYLNNPKTMRLISVLAGALLLYLAFRLGQDVFQ